MEYLASQLENMSFERPFSDGTTSYIKTCYAFEAITYCCVSLTFKADTDIWEGKKSDDDVWAIVFLTKMCSTVQDILQLKHYILIYKINVLRWHNVSIIHCVLIKC